ncbi:hypothetical protein EC973_003559 [Apophysomyces ossiformis]|uniref:SET domain-containing protein n=1 Tax=Apophysomyces ossiformis TaxID=679940 RepID=A0A8H7BLK1_9FUNG|nr:hypothetical protein EC973_003559 [Apophysomyces ossiformis]
MDFCMLSKYDDLFSDVFLDEFYLWFATIKMNADYRRPRIPRGKILDIIQRNILGKGKPNDAVEELMEIDYFKQQMTNKSPKQQQEFVQHMKRYLCMYMPKAGFEIGDTRRYSGTSSRVEACVIATKDWHVGDEMRLCTGVIACLEPSQDMELRKSNRDFSIMWSTRKGCSCLFLGPARFVNLASSPNIEPKFITLGQNSITFKVIKEIKCGEELTAFYGKHYFGENNCECKCVTCENREEGYFASQKPLAMERSDKTENDNRRSVRKRKSALHEDYMTPVPRRNKKVSTEPVQTPVADIAEDQRVISGPQKTKHQNVMSIGFLCNDETGSDTTREQTDPDSPLDLLCNVVMDAKYLRVDTSENKEIMVVVNQQISKNSLLAGKTAEQDTESQQEVDATISCEESRRSSCGSSSRPDVEISNCKADSAIGLSPYPYQRDEFDTLRTDSSSQSQESVLHNQWKENTHCSADDGFSDIDDFLDDISELSSVCSSDIWSDSEGYITSEQEIKSSRKERIPAKQELKELLCIACGRALRGEVLEQSKSIFSVASDLATWSWSPSAVFTDWKPKRCPRCERHYTIFMQEWPNRKLKKPSKRKKTKGKKIKKLAGENNKPDSFLKTSPPMMKKDLEINTSCHDNAACPLSRSTSETAGEKIC